MYLKTILALYSPKSHSKKKSHLFINPSNNTIHFSRIPTNSSSSQKPFSSIFSSTTSSYKLDKILQIGTSQYSTQHTQLFSKSCLKNLNIFLLGNDQQIKQRCIFSELKYCSIVKQLIRTLRQYTDKIYVSIQNPQTLESSKQIISSYSDFIAIWHQVKLDKIKPFRVCFEYAIDGVMYSTNVVKVEDSGKEALEIWRLKQSNKWIMRVCGREKNSMYYLCLDGEKVECQEYLEMVGYGEGRKNEREMMKDKQEYKERRSKSLKRLITQSSTSLARKSQTRDKLRPMQNQQQRYTQQLRPRSRQRQSQILSRKQNTLSTNKQHLRHKVTQKILIQKNRKIDHLTNLLSTRDLQIQDLTHRLSLSQSQLSLLTSQLSTHKLSVQSTTIQTTSTISHLQQQLKLQSQQSFQRYKQYQDRIEELKMDVDQLKKLDRITLEKFQEISKEKFTVYGKQIQELKEGNKQIVGERDGLKREVRVGKDRCESVERENQRLREEIRRKEGEFEKINLKYQELSGKLKNLITID